MRTSKAAMKNVFKLLVVLPALLAPFCASAAYQVKDFTGVVATQTLLFGLNDRGDMVGQAGDGDGGFGFVVRGQSVEKIFDASLGNWFSAQAISNTGVVAVAVSSADRPDALPWSYLYEDGKFTLVAEGRLYVRGMSPDGRFLAGLCDTGETCVYDTADQTFLASANGFNYLQGVNSSGVVAGSRLAEDPGTGRISLVGATLDLRGGQVLDYQAHQSPDGGTWLRGINDRGDLAGRAFEDDGRIYGFHRSASGVIERFVAGGTDTYVQGLNNTGVIVGFYGTPEDGYRAFVASPVPEPPTLLMAAAGLLLVGTFARRGPRPGPATSIEGEA